jgi:hypothetical protein
MKALILGSLSFISVVSFSASAIACDVNSAKADVLKNINTPMAQTNVVTTVSNIKLSATSGQNGNSDPIYEVLYSYHVSYKGTTPSDLEFDMVGYYQLDAKTCKINNDIAESVSPLN